MSTTREWNPHGHRVRPCGDHDRHAPHSVAIIVQAIAGRRQLIVDGWYWCSGAAGVEDVQVTGDLL